MIYIFEVYSYITIINYITIYLQLESYSINDLNIQTNSIFI
jgi:hypothetical protein